MAGVLASVAGSGEAAAHGWPSAAGVAATPELQDDHVEPFVRGKDRRLPLVSSVRLARDCARCGARVHGRRRRFCADACATIWTRNHVWPLARRAALTRDRACVGCGARARLEVNHVVALADWPGPAAARYRSGCRHHTANLEALCTACHNAVTHRQRRARTGRGDAALLGFGVNYYRLIPEEAPPGRPTPGRGVAGGDRIVRAVWVAGAANPTPPASHDRVWAAVANDDVANDDVANDDVARDAQERASTAARSAAPHRFRDPFTAVEAARRVLRADRDVGLPGARVATVTEILRVPTGAVVWRARDVVYAPLVVRVAQIAPHRLSVLQRPEHGPADVSMR